MLNSSTLRPWLAGAGLLLTVLGAACGQKPDGTPYGTDPAKLPEGRRKAQAATTIYQKDVPKGAEMNAVTNGTRVGQPSSAPTPPR